MNIKLKSNLVFAMVFTSAIGMAVLGFYLAKTSYDLWAYGVEKEAHIIKYEHSNYHGKAGNTYSYQIEISGEIISNDFKLKLEEGRTYIVVVLGNNSEIMLGKKAPTLFKTFVAYMGNTLMAYLCIAMYIFFIIFLPRTLIELWKKRNNLYT